MNPEILAFAMPAAAAAGVLLAVALPLVVISRWRRRRLLGRQGAAELRRAAEHIHLVAQACQRHTGNTEIGLALHQLAIVTLEKALRQAPREPECKRLLLEYREVAANTTRLGVVAGREEDEVTLSRARLLLTEATRLLGQVERDGLQPAATLQSMRHNLQQARRALELQLRLRQAAQAESLERHHVYQHTGA